MVLAIIDVVDEMVEVILAIPSPLVLFFHKLGHGSVSFHCPKLRKSSELIPRSCHFKTIILGIHASYSGVFQLSRFSHFCWGFSRSLETTVVQSTPFDGSLTR